MLGQFVKSKAGHDKDTLYIVVAEDREYVYLSDGKRKAPESPKKKRRKHVQPINRFVEDELKAALLAGETVRPEQIKYAVKQFVTIE